MLGLCYWVGVNEKVPNAGEPMPNFSSIFFQILSPPPLTWALLFFLNIGLTQTCIAIDVSPPPLPHMGTLPMHQEDDKKMQNK